MLLEKEFLDLDIAPMLSRISVGTEAGLKQLIPIPIKMVSILPVSRLAPASVNMPHIFLLLTKISLTHLTFVLTSAISSTARDTATAVAIVTYRALSIANLGFIPIVI